MMMSRVITVYGKALLAQGDPVAAKEQFARAVSMKPASKRCLKAYRRSVQRAEEG